jgi:hypothetical protein
MLVHHQFKYCWRIQQAVTTESMNFSSAEDRAISQEISANQLRIQAKFMALAVSTWGLTTQTYHYPHGSPNRGLNIIWTKNNYKALTD